MIRSFSIVASFVGFFVVVYLADQKLRRDCYTYLDTLRRHGL